MLCPVPRGSAQCRVWSVASFQNRTRLVVASPRLLTYLISVGTPRVETTTGPVNVSRTPTGAAAPPMYPQTQVPPYLCAFGSTNPAGRTIDRNSRAWISSGAPAETRGWIVPPATSSRGGGALNCGG